ncbi:MAG TPA: RHS repeat-associated core domain-containing protein [Chthonomonadales bacterium]|nr:RHS repeat-associated core domain-containing protein [Chthonomonadales bacterium]
MTTYTTVNGRILSENRNGVTTDYVPDALGSTVALLGAGQSIQATYSYWPYGSDNASTGTNPTPFRFGGTLGIARDTDGRGYCRARYLDKVKARWLTQDPIGFTGGDWNLYPYALGSPATAADFTTCCSAFGSQLGCISSDTSDELTSQDPVGFGGQ